jgi:hypothetical protein
VLEADALVAEVAAELVDPLQAAHQQPLEVQLERDAQVQVLVKLVVVGDERAAAAPPYSGWRMGVSTSKKPWSSRKRRSAAPGRPGAGDTSRTSGFTARSA